jgi:hypothetical protein
MSRSYTSSTPSAFTACSGTAFVDGAVGIESLPLKQCFLKCGPRAVSKGKALRKLYQTPNE